MNSARVITLLFGKMSLLQNPSIGSKNLARDPQITIRLLTTRPVSLQNIDPPMTPNELVGLFNGIDSTMRLFVVSGDGTALIPVASA